MTVLSRRHPPQAGQDISYSSWENSRRDIHEFMKWAFENYSGLPGGHGGIIGTVPPAVIVGDAATESTPGTQEAGWMGADAQLIVESDTPAGLANAAVEGTATTVSRSDHQHKRDVRVARAGSDIGTRNRLNFSADFTVADDGGNDEVDIGLANSPSDVEVFAWFMS